MLDCPLCHEVGGSLIYAAPDWRVVWAEDAPGYPLFCRVIWQQHCAEMTALGPAQRQQLMAVVFAVEEALLAQRPAKINLASLGNMVPHLHWHVIARYENDAHFPRPMWGQPERPVVPADVNARTLARLEVEARLHPILECLSRS